VFLHPKNMASKKIKTKTIKQQVEPIPVLPTAPDWPLVVLFSAFAIFFTLSFVFSTMAPYFQMTKYLMNIKKGWIQKVPKTGFIFTPYTYAQRVIRYEYLKYVEEQNLGSGDIALLDDAIVKMEESAVIEGSSPYQYIRLGRAMERKVEILGDPTYFKQAEIFYKKAMTLSPKRQETAYAYGLSLMRQGKNRIEEAVSVLTVALDKTIPISYYYLALAEFNSGKPRYINALTHLETFFETNQGNPDPRASQDVYEKLFQYFYSTQDQKNVLITAARIRTLQGDPNGEYQKVLDFINIHKRLPVMQFNQSKLSGTSG